MQFLKMMNEILTQGYDFSVWGGPDVLKDTDFLSARFIVCQWPLCTGNICSKQLLLELLVLKGGGIISLIFPLEQSELSVLRY